jgi:hypothetical protein
LDNFDRINRICRMNAGEPKILVERDGDGYLVCVRGSDNLFAYGLTKKQALDELANVIEMSSDYRSCQ